MRARYRIKQLLDVARALRIYRNLRAHDSWTPQQLAEHQQARFQRLLRHAVRHSPFYRELYDGIDIDGTTAPERLPIMDKETMMENYDRLVTDRRLELAELRKHLRGLTEDDYHLGGYRILSTSGTSGSSGIFAYNRSEWSVVLANALRWYRYVGVRPRLPRRLRISAIGADNPMHVSVRMVESGDVGLFVHQRLRVDMPLEELVAALNRFRPDVLLPYPSVGGLLADEQLAGRLDISPRVLSTHTEALTEDNRAKMERAWGVKAFNHYGLTELPTFASECEAHRGLHVFTDLLHAEVVDENNRPVPPGQAGRKLLLTNLYNFTQPIIRYEVSDMLTMATEGCPCGRPFPLVASLGGRAEDIIHLAGRDGREVAVPPMVFEETIEAVERIARYQVAQRRDGIHVRVVPQETADREQLSRELARRLTDRLEGLGAEAPNLTVDFVAEIERPRTVGSKMKLVTTELDEQSQ